MCARLDVRVVDERRGSEPGRCRREDGPTSCPSDHVLSVLRVGVAQAEAAELGSRSRSRPRRSRLRRSARARCRDREAPQRSPPDLQAEPIAHIVVARRSCDLMVRNRKLTLRRRAILRRPQHRLVPRALKSHWRVARNRRELRLGNCRRSRQREPRNPMIGIETDRRTTAPTELGLDRSSQPATGFTSLEFLRHE